jgi:hypothetical protein
MGTLMRWTIGWVFVVFVSPSHLFIKVVGPLWKAPTHVLKGIACFPSEGKEVNEGCSLLVGCDEDNNNANITFRQCDDCPSYIFTERGIMKSVTAYQVPVDTDLVDFTTPKVLLLDNFMVDAEHALRTRFEMENEYDLNIKLDSDSPAYNSKPWDLQNLFDKFNQTQIFQNCFDLNALVV